MYHRWRAVAQPGFGVVHLRAASPVPKRTVAESVVLAPWLFCRPQTKASLMPWCAACLPCAASHRSTCNTGIPVRGGEGRACCTDTGFGALELLAQAQREPLSLHSLLFTVFVGEQSSFSRGDTEGASGITAGAVMLSRADWLLVCVRLKGHVAWPMTVATNPAVYI